MVTAGIVIEQRDFDAALDFMQSAHSDSIGAPKVCILGMLYSVFLRQKGLSLLQSRSHSGFVLDYLEKSHCSRV